MFYIPVIGLFLTSNFYGGSKVHCSTKVLNFYRGFRQVQCSNRDDIGSTYYNTRDDLCTCRYYTIIERI